MLELHSKRLLLRGMLPADAEAVFRYRSDKKANQYQGWIPGSLADVRDFIDHRVLPTFNKVGSWYQFVIILKDKEQLIGDLGVHFIDNEQTQVELGCTISAAFQQQGFATEAMSNTISYLFHELSKHRIQASVDPENLSSIKLLKGLGFRKEVHFKESFLINGEWVDDVVYALLKSAWPVYEKQNISP